MDAVLCLVSLAQQQYVASSDSQMTKDSTLTPAILFGIQFSTFTENTGGVVWAS